MQSYVLTQSWTIWLNIWHESARNNSINIRNHNKTVCILHGTYCMQHIIGHPRVNDVMMSAMASQITSLTIVYSTSKIRVTGLCEGNSPVTGEFPTQRASNAENVSIWWRHNVCIQTSGARLLEDTVPATEVKHVILFNLCMIIDCVYISTD